MATVPFTAGLEPVVVTPTPPAGPLPETPPAGAVDNSAYDVLRAHLNPALVGSNWDIVLRALAAGDTYVRGTGRDAFDQLFSGTAEGQFLDSRGADVGIRRPANIGVSDEAFRKIILNHKTGQVTLGGLLKTAEAYYGSDATRAFLEASSAEPYAVEDGDTLIIETEQGERLRVGFKDNDFQTPGAATAMELAAVINRHLRWYRLGGYAVSYANADTNLTTLKIYSGALGLRGWVRCWGGKAQLALDFPTAIPTTQVAGTTWTVGAADRADWTRLTWSGGADPSLHLVHVGDYVACYGIGWAALNVGSYEVMAATNTYIDIANDAFTAESYAIAAAEDILFFRPTKQTIQTREHFAVVAQRDLFNLDILLPATSEIVVRGPTSGSYLNGGTAIAVTAVSRTLGSTTATLTTATPHGLVAGSRVVIDGVAGVPGVQVYGGSAQPSMSQVRWGHTATLLDNGKVLVAGGANAALASTATCQLYDPTTDTWSAAASMSDPRAYHCAVKLQNGRVLVINGDDGGTIDTCEVYDPDADVWVPTGSTGPGRMKFGAVLLPDGRVWACGGVGESSSEIYDPDTGLWTTTAAMAGIRSEHCVVALPSGQVLIAGGKDGGGTAQSTTWVYNPAIDTYTVSAAMGAPRAGAAAVYVAAGAGGKVVLCGGVDATPTPKRNTFVYDLAKNNWTSMALMADARYNHGLVVLPDGKLMALGGEGGGDEAEIYDVRRDTWVGSGGWMNDVRFLQGLVLNDGRVFVCGGGDSGGGVYSDVFTYSLKKVVCGGGINGFFEVTGSVGLTFDITTELTSALALTGLSGTVTSTEPVDSGHGPFVYDPVAGLAITGVESTTGQNLNAGDAYATVTITDSSLFPDSTGWVVFAYGEAEQVGPVRYTNRPTSTTLVLDRSYTFPATVPAGASVVLLKQRGGWVPASPQNYGALWATASTAGRVAAEDAFGRYVAAGVEENLEILFPGDFGLGGHGNPTNGVAKLSDAAMVWGGDDVDDELALRRSTP